MGRQYTHVQAVEKEMLEMKAAGKTNREIAEHFGFKDKYVVKEWSNGITGKNGKWKRESCPAVEADRQRDMCRQNRKRTMKSVG